MFELGNKNIVITGGAGLLGRQHAEAVAEYGANPIILDIDQEKSQEVANKISSKYKVNSCGLAVDITKEDQVEKCCRYIKDIFGGIDVLINNAANNPQVGESGLKNTSRLEFFPLATWNQDVAVGLTGAFLCSKHFGFEISKRTNGGSIINISSDLGVMAPDQRLYRKDGLEEEKQSVKPVTYSVIKSGLIGLTLYLSTYWAENNVRCNALCPGGVYNNQDKEFLVKVQSRIPLGRMAKFDEYKGAIVFLASSASSYMNGAVLNIDGGRTAW